ncbi:MAG TPA: deoxyguanosinetriphosphate triphosphohydrolase [Thermodesulfovibrionia bacterium]|nr:deoxyguanosinetriphosphate triphosphohydrolase [Thermodesulfovibrionia bacterium]
MTIRERTEATESEILHEAAALSSRTKGRVRPEMEGLIRTAFQRDRDRIIHSKAFRRLKHKTQVFLAPQGDHYRTRLTHTLEVSQVARTIARALRLNEDLTEAIALGHDLGHPPFGHAGEAILSEVAPCGFNHYAQSLRIVDCLELKGQGLNLTFEVRNGIVMHSKGMGEILMDDGSEMAATLEGQIVRVSDVIAYANHDLDDALRAGVLQNKDIPGEILTALGDTNSRRIDNMVTDVIYTTMDSDYRYISMSSSMKEQLYCLRDFLYAHVYENKVTKKEFFKAKKILKELYEYYMEHSFGEEEYVPHGDPRERVVCDFIAGMTDRFAIATYEKLFIPQPWTVL